MQCLVKVPYVDLSRQNAAIKDELMEAVAGVIDHGNLILGDEVATFEHQFAQLCGVKYALGVNSGTDALILALKVLGIGEGEEVITVANSFISSASCIVCTGARPVFVDVGDDLNIDPAQIEAAITPKTKAILPVHWTGRPADMDQILSIAKKHHLAVIEDCAQAVTAAYQGDVVGSLGDIGCFSLHPLKTLNACGDGGVLTTNDPELYEKVQILRDNGFTKDRECITWSNNSRLDSLQAAMLLVKMKYVKEWTQRRINNARFYQDHLAEVPQVIVPNERPGMQAVYHTFVIQAEHRDELMDYLADKGVDSKIHYATPIHLQPVAKGLGYGEGSLPVTERQAKSILSLPVHQDLDEEMLEYVVNTIKEFYKHKGEV